MKTPSTNHSVHSQESDHSNGDVDAGHSIDKGPPDQRAFSFLRRGSSKRKRVQNGTNTSSSNDKEFKNGLRPVHIAPNTLPRPSSTDDNERGGTKPPSLQTTPVTPHSPLSAFSPFNSPRVSPLPSRRPPSPRRIDMGFASAVSNLVEQAHSIADQDRRKAYVLPSHIQSDRLAILAGKNGSEIQAPQMRNKAKQRSTMRPHTPIQSSMEFSIPTLSQSHHNYNDETTHSERFISPECHRANISLPAPQSRDTMEPRSSSEYSGQSQCLNHSPITCHVYERKSPRKLPTVPSVPDAARPGLVPGPMPDKFRLGRLDDDVIAARKPATLNLPQAKLKDTTARVLPSPRGSQSKKSINSSINFPQVSASPTHVSRHDPTEEKQVLPLQEARRNDGGSTARQIPPRSPSFNRQPPSIGLSSERQNEASKQSYGRERSPHKIGQVSTRLAHLDDSTREDTAASGQENVGQPVSSPRTASGQSPRSDRMRTAGYQSESASDLAIAGMGRSSQRRTALASPIANGFSGKVEERGSQPDKGDVTMVIMEESEDEDDWC